MQPLTPEAIPAALDWLTAQAQGPLFLEHNLRCHGLAGDDPLSVHVWHGAGGMIGLTVGGVLLPQIPDPASWPDARAVLRARAITGIIAEAAQTAAARAALSIPPGARLDRIEPAFSLNLDDLIQPDTTGLTLRAISPGDLPLLYRWNTDYRIETMNESPETAATLACANIDSYAAGQSHAILWRGADPVAMTGFNARLPDRVQIGGVYTPPALRRRGHARAAVALHLAEARAQGIKRAFLFAANDRAARAYTALGFRPAGQVGLLILDPPHVIP